MGLSDPFSTTYEGSFKAGQSLGQGLESAASSVATAMQTKQKQAQAQKMLQTIGFGKQTGAIKTEEIPLDADEYNKQAEDMLSKAGPSVFNSNTVLTGSKDPTERMNQYQQLFKAAGIPGPKPKTVTTVDAEKMNNAQKFGYTVNPSTGEVSIHSTEIDPMAQEMKAERMDMEKQRLKDQEDSKNSTVATNLNKQVNPMNASRGSQLGKIGETTVRAKRALDLLNDPNFKINSQVLSGIGSDMAGILQGGSPTQIGMNEQGYATLQTTLAKAGQYLDAHPGDALPQDMRDYLTTTFNKLNDTGKYYIKNNLKTVEDLQKPWVSKNKDIWSSTKQDIYDTYGLEDDSNGATSTLKAAGMGNKSQMSDEDGYNQLQSMRGK